jgi:hypothetical protein
VAGDDSLFLLDPASGNVLRRARASGLSLNPPAAHDGLVVFASALGRIEAWDAASLEPRWTVATRDPVLGPPAIARDTVFALTAAGTLWSVPLAAPETAVPTELGIAARASPVALAGGVLVASLGGELMLVGTGVPTPRWSVRVDGPLEHAPLVVQGLLLFVDGRGRIQAWK